MKWPQLEISSSKVTNQINLKLLMVSATKFGRFLRRAGCADPFQPLALL